MSDAIKNAIEAMEFAQYAVGPFHRVATKKLRDSIAGLKAAQAQASDPVAVADNGVLNWIDGKQFDHEADLYTAPPAASNGDSAGSSTITGECRMTKTNQYEFGCAPLKIEGGFYYSHPPKEGTAQWVKMVLETSTRIGLDKDEPKGARYIMLSETLVNKMIEALEVHNEI